MSGLESTEIVALARIIRTAHPEWPLANVIEALLELSARLGGVAGTAWVVTDYRDTDSSSLASIRLYATEELARQAETESLADSVHVQECVIHTEYYDELLSMLDDGRNAS